MTPKRLTGIFLYPLKSAAGIAVDAWPVDEFGLRGDRRSGKEAASQPSRRRNREA
ncbi:MAG: hypothetical protein ACE5JR_01370 [Gemmatimonadota bacterium]